MTRSSSAWATRSSKDRENRFTATGLPSARVAGTVVRRASEAGRDQALAARAAVEGAYFGAKELGLNAAEAAAAAARASLKAVTEGDPGSAESVRKALSESMGGVRIALRIQGA